MDSHGVEPHTSIPTGATSTDATGLFDNVELTGDTQHIQNANADDSSSLN